MNRAEQIALLLSITLRRLLRFFFTFSLLLVPCGRNTARGFFDSFFKEVS